MCLMGSALVSGGSVAEQVGTGCVQHRAIPNFFPQRTPLKPPNYQNLAIYTQSESKGGNVSACNNQMLFTDER